MAFSMSATLNFLPLSSSRICLAMAICVSLLILVGQGITAARLTASGKGESDPIAGNDSAADRQQNRRVDVIIANPAP